MSAIGVCGGSGIADLGARGDSGSPATPALGDSGIEFAICPTGARGIGEFNGLSPGRGLMGKPGLSMADGAGAFSVRDCRSEAARLRTTS